MAHHVCPRSNARLIEEVTRSKDRTTHDTRYEGRGYETRPRERNWSERTSFVRLRFFVSRESHFHAFIICNLIWSPALSNSPVELDKGKKKNSGTLYTIIYIYIPENETTRARRDFVSPPLFFSLFRPSSSTDTRCSPGTNITSAPVSSTPRMLQRRLVELDGHSGRVICN